MRARGICFDRLLLSRSARVSNSYFALAGSGLPSASRPSIMVSYTSTSAWLMFRASAFLISSRYVALFGCRFAISAFRLKKSSAETPRNMVPSSLFATMYWSSGGRELNSACESATAVPPAAKSLLPSGKPGSQPSTAIETAIINGSLNLISNLSVPRVPVYIRFDTPTLRPDKLN